MELNVMDHPLVSHKLTLLRSVDTPSPVFRQLVEELVTLMAYEAPARCASSQPPSPPHSPPPRASP
ncbi:uracil phosphoribosyltransferase [Cutibacterium acnes JCM 18918]|nr:uracil phosphoribosyltransferase [Cutibacterium acnes JCM 18918]